MAKFGICVLLAPFLYVTVVAQDCIDYGSFPHRIGGVDYTGGCADLAIAGDFAFVPIDYQDLRVFDISDPSHPVYAGSAETTTFPTDVKIAGDYAFVLDMHVGMEVFDITEPSVPIRLANVEIGGYLVDLAVAGSTVFVLSLPSDDALPSYLTVIDVGNPTDPMVVAHVDLPARGAVVEVSDDRLYFLEYSAYMHIYDITTPTVPVLLHSLAIGAPITSFAVDGTLALVGGQIVWVVDLADPAGPTIVGSVEPVDDTHTVAIDGHVGYLIDTQAGLSLIDLVDPTAPVIVAMTGIQASGRALAIVDDLAFVAGSGIDVVDVSNPTGPAISAVLDMLDSPTDIAVLGNLAYVGDADTGFNVIDISIPTDPVVLGSVATQGSIREIALAGSLACVACGRYTALEIVDISNPEAPEVIGALQNAYHDTWDVAVTGSYAYTIWGDFYDQYYPFQKIQVVDISEPTNPNLVTTLNMPDATTNITIHGTVAYVGGYYEGFHVVDLSIPENPQIVGSFGSPCGAYTVAIHDNYLYTAGGSLMNTFDITEPMSPQLISTAAVGPVDGIAATSSYLYLVGDRGGLKVLDISAPDEPVLCGYANNPWWAWSVVTLDHHVLIAGSSGLQVFLPQCADIVSVLADEDRQDTPTASIRLAVSPNPFNPRTTVSFGLDRRQHVTVEIFDLRGRRVRTLVDGVVAEGDHSARWDGRDHQGTLVPSGTYVLRFASAMAVRSEKMVLVR